MAFAVKSVKPNLKMKRYLILLLLSVLPALSQSTNGELRLKVTDPSRLGVRSTVKIVSEANQYENAFVTDDTGNLVVQRLPYGVYRVHIDQPDFAPASKSIEIRSAIPVEYVIRLELASANTVVTVTDAATMIDPHRSGSVSEIGSELIENRPSSLPGRSVQDLVNSQPGWLYEGNAVLHPRGSEYQTQFVIDGIPLTDNRSPSFGPEIEADDIDSMSIYTAGIPAEYGRKMGGVIEVNTKRESQAGLHGQVIASGGSFETAGGFAQIQDIWGKNVLGASVDGDRTGRYLSPVVPENFTNRGTTGDFSVNYERDLTPSDRLGMSVRHELSRFELPNEQLQEAAGQRQNADNFETMGSLSYQHVFSSNVVGNFRGMVRDNSDNLYSNALSTPIIAFEHNYFREGYFKSTVSIHRDIQEWKVGVESDATFLHENFSDIITDFTRFENRTPATFSFRANRPDLEQSAFVEDMIRLGKWTVSAGLRWDHYQLLVNQNAVSPRLSISRYFPSAGMVLHASYDRVFQTPSFENILIASSSSVTSLNPSVLRLPVEPSHGDYYEAGMTKNFFDQFRLDVNVFRRAVNNFADDDQLLSTAVSFPIAFRKAIIYGTEGKIELPHWGNLSGFLSYSYTVGNAWFPVTGGLFLGDNATNATTQLTGHFPDSQDQRNTVRTRFRYQLLPRLWVAAGADYGSGLPFDFGGTVQQALAQYGPQVVSRINFDRGRIKPAFAVNVSLGVDLYKSKRLDTRFQIDGENLNNRLNVIDFGGLFSGNAIAPPRSYALRLTTIF